MTAQKHEDRIKTHDGEFIPLSVQTYRDTASPPETEAKDDFQASIAAYSGEPLGVFALANPYPMIRGLVDIRNQLRRQSWGGPTARRSLAQKSGGVVVHFAGPAQNRSLSALARLQSYASYHCRPDGFGRGATGNGLMYHLGIAEDGTKYLCRDLEEDRWHCGAWPHNGTWISIQIPIGEGQSPTAAQIKSVGEIVLDWLKYKGLSRAFVAGHRQVGQSNCPGSLIMDRIVTPLRSGQNPGGSNPAPSRPPAKPKPPKKSYPTKGYNFVANGSRDEEVAFDAAAALAADGYKNVAVFTSPESIRGVSEEWFYGNKVADRVGIVVGTPVIRHLYEKVGNVFTDDGILFPVSRTDTWDAAGRGNYAHPDGGFTDTEHKVLVCLIEICRREGLNTILVAASYARSRGWLADEGFPPAKKSPAPEKPARRPEAGPKRGVYDFTGEARHSRATMVEYAKSMGCAKPVFDMIPHYYLVTKTLREMKPEEADRVAAPDALIVQMIHETGKGKYRGDSRAYNPAGIKLRSASGDTPSDFEVPRTAREGVRMHVNHASAYTHGPTIGAPHGRYHLAKAIRASKPPVKHMKDLAGSWAADPLYFEPKLRKYFDALEAFDSKANLASLASDTFSLEIELGEPRPESPVKVASSRAAIEGPLVALISYALISYGAPADTPEILAGMVSGGIGVYAAAQRIVEGIYDRHK